MTSPPSAQGQVRPPLLLPGDAWELRCPQCGVWGRISDDQLHGRVSVDHSIDGPVTAYTPMGCSFHEVRDWFTTAERCPPSAARCPEPFWHKTHRYCPVCDWQEPTTPPSEAPSGGDQ